MKLQYEEKNFTQRIGELELTSDENGIVEVEDEALAGMLLGRVKGWTRPVEQPEQPEAPKTDGAPEKTKGKKSKPE